jgi:ornithine cyclodeaminase/alanine dehydrogenase-like protein (mu-crystallin family)
MLILSEEEVQRFLGMEQCIEAVEQAFRELGKGTAHNIPRGRIRTDPFEVKYSYWMNCIPGAVPALGVAALRIDSAVQVLSEDPGRTRGPLRDYRYCGLVLLFETESGKLLAILPDFTISGVRVGATTAVGVKYLARPDASQVALFGSGKQARTNLEGVACVRKVERAAVFSPNPSHQKAFAVEMSHKLGFKVVPASSAEEALGGADIVVCATNAMAPVFDGNLLEQGSHVASIVGGDRHDRRIRGRLRQEVDDTTIERSDLVILNSREQARLDEQADVAALLRSGRRGWEEIYELGELLNGEAPGRTDPRQITLHLNNTGMGIQFAAAASVVYRKARAEGAGRELPDDWFSIDLRAWAERGFHPSP